LDLNGDGFADVAIGSPQYGETDGVAYVHLGGPRGIATRPDATLMQSGSGPLFGTSIASASDVNGDGYGDLVVGA
jgi:hypothetical protein